MPKRPPELHLYDFDGTLFRSPHRPDWWPADRHWWANPASLAPPVVPKKPDNSWWVAPVVAQAQMSIERPHVYTVLATGRKEPVFRYRVPRLLAQKRLRFDEVHLSDRESTLEFKLALLADLLSHYPQVRIVRIWDDRVQHLQAFTHGLSGRAHVMAYPVVAQPKPVAPRAAKRNPKPEPVPDDRNSQAYLLFLEQKAIPALEAKLKRAKPEDREEIRAELEGLRADLNQRRKRWMTRRELAEGKKKRRERATREAAIRRWVQIKADRGELVTKLTGDSPEVIRLAQHLDMKPGVLATRLNTEALAQGLQLARPARKRMPRPVEGKLVRYASLPRWMKNKLYKTGNWSIGPAMKWAKEADARQEELEGRLWDVFTDWAMDPRGGADLVKYTPEGKIEVDRISFNADNVMPTQYQNKQLKKYADKHLSQLLKDYRAAVEMKREQSIYVPSPYGAEDEDDPTEKGAAILEALEKGSPSDRSKAAAIRLHLGTSSLPGRPLRFMGGPEHSQAAKDAELYHGAKPEKGTCPTCRAIVRFFRVPGLTVAHVQGLMKWWEEQEQAGRYR